jgi:hypothetical protein
MAAQLGDLLSCHSRDVAHFNKRNQFSVFTPECFESLIELDETGRTGGLQAPLIQ